MLFFLMERGEVLGQGGYGFLSNGWKQKIKNKKYTLQLGFLNCWDRRQFPFGMFGKREDFMQLRNPAEFGCVQGHTSEYLKAESNENFEDHRGFSNLIWEIPEDTEAE